MYAHLIEQIQPQREIKVPYKKTCNQFASFTSLEGTPQNVIRGGSRVYNNFLVNLEHSERILIDILLSKCIRW